MTNETHGFILLEARRIPEMATGARLFRHARTGARYLSLENDDENKVFAIAFRTRPSDSTGVAHVLEHSVLCGSRKYPLKDPFAELLRSSLQTFLNAFTYPDKTVYPVASQNLQDFRNLVDVYLDTVFHPLLRRETFLQEAWHFELETPEDRLTRKGVVYNEMKGAYSSPENVLEETIRQSLFPSTCYRHEYGGDPRHIPELTWEALREFHRTFYHPSNAWIFFYGDDDPEERLEILDAYLREFDALEIDSAIEPQPFRTRAERIVRSYAADSDGGSRPRAMLTVNWLLPETTEIESTFALHILEHALIGTPASPLRKALIDSGLGEDLAGGGLEAELRQMYFAVGLRGIRESAADDVESLVMETLERIRETGFDRGTIEAAVNTIEFTLRENNTGSFPRGLEAVLRSLTTSLYDGDPLSLLAFEAPLQRVKQRVLDDPGTLQRLIEERFLDNSHRTTVLLRPDPEFDRRREEEERRELDRIRQQMDEEEVQRVIRETIALRRFAETPDPPEVVAKVPRLDLADIPREPRRIPAQEDRAADTRVVSHEIPTRSILYLDVGLNLRVLPPEDLPYAGLLGRLFLEMGTEGEDFVSLSQRIGRETGGIRPRTFTSEIRNDPDGAAWLFLRGKCVRGKAAQLIAILGDVLLTVRLDDRERFRRIVLEEKARLEAELIPSGHHVVARFLAARFGRAGWASDRIGGIEYLFFIRRLVQRVEDDWNAVREEIERVRTTLVDRSNMVCNLTEDEEGLRQVSPMLAEFLERVPRRRSIAAEKSWPVAPADSPVGLTIPSQVNYVGKAMILPLYRERADGSALVAARYLNMTWMWDRIRVQGGAYGGFCRFDPRSGLVIFVSYRDPNIGATLRAYDEAGEFLRRTPPEREDLERSVIGAIGTLDTHLLPDARGFVSLTRSLAGETEEERRRTRHEVLETRREDFLRFADQLAGARAAGAVAVLGSREALLKAEQDEGLGLKVVPVL